MGMHFGVLAASVPWTNFLDALAPAPGTFVDQGPVSTLDGFDPQPAEEGFSIVGGDHHGQSFILDTSMILSGGGYDRLVELSRTLDTQVAACLGETVSGSFNFFAAKHGQLQRLYYNCFSAVTEPLSVGASLPTEAAVPFEEIDGNGLFLALAHFGLPFNDWYEHGSKRAYLYNDVNDLAAPGPIDGQIQAHFERYRIPPGQEPKPTVVSRRLPDGSTGFDIVSASPTRSVGVFARLLSLLRLR